MSNNHNSYQGGILAPASSNALFITLNRDPLKCQPVKSLLKQVSQLPNYLFELQKAYPEAELYLTLALSSDFWDFLEILPKPKQLQGFKAIHNQQVSMPATDADMILHIRSQRHDINYLLALRLFEQLTPAMQLDEMVHGFKYLDSRDLTGFVDGTENPEGKEREQVAIVANDAPFNGGSYLHLQKYQHQLNDWQALSLKQQEDSYGRTKAENIEYPAAQKSQCAHTKRTSIKDLQGKGIEILRHSLPFGDLNQSGLLFASYGASPESFNLMLESMCQLDENSATDSILRVTSAVSGHAFFAPNLDWFKQFQNS